MMEREKAKNTARRIVHAIEADFTDRRRPKQVWDAIDDQIKESIRKEWRQLVYNILRGRGE